MFHSSPVQSPALRLLMPHLVVLLMLLLLVAFWMAAADTNSYQMVPGPDMVLTWLGWLVALG
jgi:hypothetical protein